MGKWRVLALRAPSSLIWGDGGLLFHFILSKIVGETKRRLKDRFNEHFADQLTTHLVSPNPPQSQNTFLLMITLLRTSHFIPLEPSLRNWRYCVGARLKFWRRSRVPIKGSRDAAVKSHLTILQRLRGQISLDYYTIPPATQAN